MLTSCIVFQTPKPPRSPRIDKAKLELKKEENDANAAPPLTSPSPTVLSLEWLSSVASAMWHNPWAFSSYLQKKHLICRNANMSLEAPAVIYHPPSQLAPVSQDLPAWKANGRLGREGPGTDRISGAWYCFHDAGRKDSRNWPGPR
ncbi:hypothetical protein VTJ04DRAFT_7910 [Mycothermus thermophilus]|uniref:uncharacterized protein n=1 Tax=Humicola insolens TaxID=85995 RepID=UPI0037440BD4